MKKASDPAPACMYQLNDPAAAAEYAASLGNQALLFCVADAERQAKFFEKHGYCSSYEQEKARLLRSVAANRGLVTA